MPSSFREWNQRWGAPRGFSGYPWPLRGTRFDVRKRGPFAYQTNNTTREFEYPWVYEQVTQRGTGLTVVDVGGSLAGMQFVLAKAGYRVINVDPGVKAGGLGWDIDLKLHRWLCRRLGADVEMISASLADSGLESATADVVVCVSALEHFSDADLETTASSLQRILKPDGLAVFTVDCFLDVTPFTDLARNDWGRNIAINDFLEQAGLQLESGDPNELHGFPEFRPAEVLKRLSELHVGQHYPCLAQCFTATPKHSLITNCTRDS